MRTLSFLPQLSTQTHTMIAKLSRCFSSSSSSSSSSHFHPDGRRALSLQSLLKRGFTPTLRHFNRFLLFLSQSQKFSLIIHFYSQMTSNQIKGTCKTHSIFTWALLNSLRFAEAEHFMKTQMGKSSNFPTPRMWDSLIRGVCVKLKDPEKAMSLLEDCLRNHGMLLSSHTICSLVHSFSFIGEVGKAVEVLKLMSDERVKYPFDNFVCSSVISGFCKIGKPELAMEFFENATGLGVLQPNVVTYTASVSALCMLGRFEEVNDLVCRIEREGLALDVVLYSSWICGYFNHGLFKEALQKHGIMVGYFNHGLFKEALQKHGIMVGQGVNPDTISYSILINGFSKEGNVEKAVGFLKKMMDDGLEPNLFTYTAIISGFCKKGKLDEAFAVVKMVDSLGIEMDEFAYATLIDGVCRFGDIARAYHLLEEMEMKGINPSIVTYNTLINGLCKARKTSEADQISKGMTGDVITYSTLLHGYTEEENATGIMETKRRLGEAGVRMDVIMCNVLIKALFMVGAFEDAYALYKDMPKNELVANSVTYCSLINGYFKMGRIDEALEIFDEFRQTSLSSVACYNSIINWLCKKGMVLMAIEVFMELNDKGLTLDIGVYAMLVKAIFQEESAVGVLNFICRIEHLGLHAYNEMCNDAICFLCKRGFPVAAGELCLLVKRKGLLLTSKSYCLVLRGVLGEENKWLSWPLLGAFVKEYGLIEPRVRKILLHYLILKDVNTGFSYLDKLNSNMSVVTFPKSFLKKLVKDGKVLGAYKLIMDAKVDFLNMDVVDYTIMIDGLCKDGYLSEALDICAFAKTKGITLNIVSYNIVINGLCRQGRLIEAFRLFDSLERIDLVPSEITYATLIDALCREGFLLDAKQLFDKMVVKGLKPNVHIYNSFVDVHCKFGRLEEALELLDGMENNCLKPDAFTVSAIINGFCRKCDMEGALACFFEFEKKGVLPDFLGFMYLIRGLYDKGRMEEARNIIRELLQTESVMELINKVDIGVDTESMGGILVSLCDQGSIREAVTVLNEVGHILFPVQGSITHPSSPKLKKLHKWEALDAVTSKCETSPFKVDLGFGSCDVEEIEKVAHCYDNLERSSQCHDFESYYSRIASFCSKGELAQANELAREILSFSDRSG